MKILFLGEERGMITKLAASINALTEHEALAWRRLKQEPKFRTEKQGSVYIGEDGLPHEEMIDVQIPDGVQIIPCPMTNPDVIVNVGQGWVTFEMEQAMGLVSNPNRKRVLYLMSAPKGRGGIYSPHAPEWLFNDAWFTQCIDDKLHLKKQDGTLLWNDATDAWLPLPVDITGITAATPPNSLKIGFALSGGALSIGGWDKGVETIYGAYQASGCEIDLIMDVSYSDAMTRKAACSIIFDSDKGNIGVSGLESLAQGIPVLAKLSPAVIACFEQLGEGFPVITFTDQADLNTKLIYYKTHLEELAAIGTASRAWMLANYTPQKIADYWCNNL